MPAKNRQLVLQKSFINEVVPNIYWDNANRCDKPWTQFILHQKYINNTLVTNVLMPSDFYLHSFPLEDSSKYFVKCSVFTSRTWSDFCKTFHRNLMWKHGFRSSKDRKELVSCFCLVALVTPLYFWTFLVCSRRYVSCHCCLFFSWLL